MSGQHAPSLTQVSTPAPALQGPHIPPLQHGDLMCSPPKHVPLWLWEQCQLPPGSWERLSRPAGAQGCLPVMSADMQCGVVGSLLQETALRVLLPPAVRAADMRAGSPAAILDLEGKTADQRAGDLVSKDTQVAQLLLALVTVAAFYGGSGVHLLSYFKFHCQEIFWMFFLRYMPCQNSATEHLSGLCGPQLNVSLSQLKEKTRQLAQVLHTPKGGAPTRWLKGVEGGAGVCPRAHTLVSSTNSSQRETEVCRGTFTLRSHGRLPVTDRALDYSHPCACKPPVQPHCQPSQLVSTLL